MGSMPEQPVRTRTPPSPGYLGGRLLPNGQGGRGPLTAMRHFAATGRLGWRRWSRARPCGSRRYVGWGMTIATSTMVAVPVLID